MPMEVNLHNILIIMVVKRKNEPDIICTALRDTSRPQFYKHIGGGVVEWITRRTSNLRIASRMGSNPVRDKPLFP